MSTPFLSEIRIVSFNFPPKGWAFCNGQTLPINQNQALFSLMGTTYGGDGQTTFKLPNLQGRVPIHMGSSFTEGQVGGEELHTLSVGELPAHVHGGVKAVAAVATTPTPTTSTALAAASRSTTAASWSITWSCIGGAPQRVGAPLAAMMSFTP